MAEDKSAAKAVVRGRILAGRAARDGEERARADDALLRHALDCQASVIAAYVPMADEPGSAAVLDELARSATVLLPITAKPGEPLRWSAYDGASSLVRGPFGLRQPAAPDGSAVTDADLVLVPALAIGRDGTRLGRGGGFYDRSLIGIDPQRLCGVVYDDEVLDTLPVDEHDVRVGRVCTPGYYGPPREFGQPARR